jgi:hypothetical protein
LVLRIFRIRKIRERLNREQEGADLMTVSILRSRLGSGTTNNLRKALLLFLLLVGFSFLYPDANADGATFCVTNPEELRSALTTAVGNGEDDLINVVQGIYGGSFIYASTEAYGLTIRGGFNTGCDSRVVDANNTVLDAHESGPVLVLTAPSQPANFVVDALTLQNGAVIGNSGGGLYINTYFGDLTLSNSIISNNSSDSGVSGVSISAPQTATIINNTITSNYSSHPLSLFGGGGMVVGAFGQITVINNRFVNNSSFDEGGGIRVWTAGDNNAAIRLTDNTFTTNSADSGGAVLIYIGLGPVALINNIMDGNAASEVGGAVYLRATYSNGGGTVTLANNVIDGNSAWRGGGIYIDEPALLNIVNNTITNNSADSTHPDGAGGGLFFSISPETTASNIYNNIFWGNSSPNGADLYLLNDADLDYLPSIVNISKNDFDQSAAGTYIQIPFSIDPSNLNKIDPLFVNPVNGDFRLQTTSLCIDTGDSLVPAHLPLSDIDGNPRIVNGIVDMGAFEYQGTDQYTLTVGVTPSSAWGFVTKGPDKPAYDYGDVVTVTATANPGYSFIGWTGGLVGTDNAGTITIKGSRTVVAHFAESSKVTLLTPNGGEVIPSGSICPIRWGAPIEAVRFKLFYSLDNGVTWKLISDSATGRNFDWQVPKLNINRKACRVKVVAFDAAGRKLKEDKSDKLFTIEVVRVISPNGGEILPAGGDYNIIWETHVTKSDINSVKLFYTKDGKTTWKRIVFLNNPGQYLWKVPIPNVPKTKCQVRVVLIGRYGNIIGTDISDDYFTIQPATSP